MRAVGKTVVYNYKIPTWRESWYAKNNIHTTAKIEDILRGKSGNSHMHLTHIHRHKHTHVTHTHSLDKR